MKSICRFSYFLALSIILGLNGCVGNSTQNSTDNVKDSNADSNDKVEISIIGENSASMQAMQALESKYEANNSGIDLVFHVNTFDEANRKSNQDFVNKSGIYDIILQYNFSLASFVGNNYVYNIDELFRDVPDGQKQFESNLYPNSWKEVGYFYKDLDNPSAGIVKVGYPFASNSMLLYYNKELLSDSRYKADYLAKYNKNLSIPTTWEDFYSVAEYFADKSKGTYGVCLQGAGDFLYYEFTNILYSMGGQIMKKEFGWEGDANTPIQFNTAESIKALEYYKSLKPFNNGSFETVGQTEQMNILKKKKTALAIVWSDMIYSTIKTENGIDPSFGFATIPGDKSVLAGGAYYVNRQSKHVKEAAEYILYLMQDSTQVALSRHGLSSASSISYKDPMVQKLPYCAALKESLERGGVVFEAGLDATTISNIINTYIQKYWNNELSTRQTVEQATIEITKAHKLAYSK